MDDSEVGVWITEHVAIPEPLLSAHGAKKLVLFVGAGASVGAPSSLPPFKELASSLADLARVEYDDTNGIDYFLGSMPDGFDVHRHARDMIDARNSRPNSTHRAIVKLATSSGAFRVVTTNFDTHLSTVAEAEDITGFKTWAGPALPLGNEFVGMVHLHGRVTDEPSQLVLTDRNFGRAYLTDAWATRFLLPMFQEFTVLFVGYSHDDPIMRYLALGLPSRTARYVLADSSGHDHTKWSRLGVTKIGYPVVDGDHGALVAALEAWDFRARMRSTEHGSQMAEIVRAGTSLTPVDRDYIIARLDTEDGANDFVRSASATNSQNQMNWLRWLEENPQFRGLFGHGSVSPSGAVLGWWFASNFVSSPSLNIAALQTIERLGQSLSPELFIRLGRSVDQLAKTDPLAGQRWKALLATSIHGQSAPPMMSALLPYTPGELGDHPVVLRAALRPSLSLKRSWVEPGDDDDLIAPRAELRWQLDGRALAKHLKQAMDARPEEREAIGFALEDALVFAYQLLEAYEGFRAHDPLSFRRSAIEDHPQDRRRDPLDAIVDSLRDFGESVLDTRPHVIEEWWSRGRRLFRRLSLHLLRTSSDRTADDKIEFVLERADLYEVDIKHELFAVLASSANHAAPETKRRLLSAALVGPDLPPDMPERTRHTAYAVYNLLLWLSQNAESWIEVHAALAAIRVENPTFAPRDHPDFDRWMTSGTWGQILPMEPEDFIQAFSEDRWGTISTIIDHDYSDRGFERPEWSDALALIKQVVETRADLGLAIWSELRSHKVDERRAKDIWRTVTDGWAEVDLKHMTLTATKLVASQVAEPTACRSISGFLLGQIRLNIESVESDTVAAFRDLARELWSHHAGTYAGSKTDDPLTFAPLYLNSWPGDIARFWLSEIDRRWRTNRTSWTGLRVDEIQTLRGLLNGTTAVRNATVPAIAGELYFLFAADQPFVISDVMPLFIASESSRLAWHPYLYRPRYDDRLLGAGLYDALVAQYGRLSELEDELVSNFFSLVLHVVSFSTLNESQKQILLDRSVLDGHAESFANAVVHFVSTTDVDGAQVWRDWLGKHVASRIDGIPRNPRMDELAGWAHLVPYVGDSAPEAIELLRNLGIGFDANFFEPTFDPKILAKFEGEFISFYAERIVSSDPKNALLGYQVRELIETLRKEVGNAAVAPLESAATQTFIQW